MNPDPIPAAKNVTRLCPLLSNAITYDQKGSDGKFLRVDGKPVRIHDLARSPCIKGDCELFDIKTFRCIFKTVLEREQ
jgi:hypothetical protein